MIEQLGLEPHDPVETLKDTVDSLMMWGLIQPRKGEDNYNWCVRVAFREASEKAEKARWAVRSGLSDGCCAQGRQPYQGAHRERHVDSEPHQPRRAREGAEQALRLS